MSKKQASKKTRRPKDLDTRSNPTGGAIFKY